MSLIVHRPTAECKHALPVRDRFGQIMTVGTRCSYSNCTIHKAISDYNNFKELCKHDEECEMRRDSFSPCLRMHTRADVFNMIYKIKGQKPDAMLHFLETMTVHQFRHYFRESEQWDYFNKYRMMEIYRPLRSHVFEQRDREQREQIRQEQREQEQREQQLREQQEKQHREQQEKQQREQQEQQMRMIQQNMFQNMFQQMFASQASGSMMNFPQMINPSMFALPPAQIVPSIPLLPSPPVARELFVPANDLRRESSRSRSREPVRERREQRRYYEY